MAKKKSAPKREKARTPREQANYRLSREERDLVARLAEDLSREYGIEVTSSDVVRKAIRLLADGRKNNSENP